MPLQNFNSCCYTPLAGSSATVRPLLVFALLMWTVSIEGLPEGRELNLTKISYGKDATTACFENDIPSDMGIRLIYNGVNHAGNKINQKSNCALFETAEKPANGKRVEYVVGFTENNVTFSVIDSIKFTFKEEITQSERKTLLCGRTSFVRTSGGSKCLNEIDNEWCFNLNIVCTNPLKKSEDQQWFEYCQTPVSTSETTMPKNNITDAVESLEYDRGLFNLKESYQDTIKYIIIVKDSLDQTPQVLRNEGDPIGIAGFEPSTASYSVCPIWKDDKYSEQAITDIDVSGEYINGHYEFSFEYNRNVQGSYAACTGTTERPSRVNKFECNKLSIAPNTRCFGYFEANDTLPLKLSYKVTGTDNTIIAYLRSSSIAVLSNACLVCFLMIFSVIQ